MTQSTLVTVDATHARVVINPIYTAADTTPAVIIERSTDAGGTWVPVRGDLADGLVSMLGGTSRTFPDAECPLDTLTQYRTIKATLAGTPVGSTFNLSASVVVSSGTACSWWAHPIINPAHLHAFTPTGDGGATYKAARGVFFPVSAPSTAATFGSSISPIVTLGKRQRRSAGKITFAVVGNPLVDDFLDSVAPESIVCIRSPAAHGWGVRYVAVLDIGEAHPSPVQGGVWLYSCDYVQVDRPTIEVVQQYGASYDDLAATYATYTALDAAYATYDAQTFAIL